MIENLIQPTKNIIALFALALMSLLLISLGIELNSAYSYTKFENKIVNSKDVTIDTSTGEIFLFNKNIGKVFINDNEIEIKNKGFLSKTETFKIDNNHNLINPEPYAIKLFDLYKAPLNETPNKEITTREVKDEDIYLSISQKEIANEIVTIVFEDKLGKEKMITDFNSYLVDYNIKKENIINVARLENSITLIFEYKTID